ncbi:hypothetical protein NX021_18020 [Cytobacillus firmus]|nr:hypothetical protein [Cytobacillus firmus]
MVNDFPILGNDGESIYSNPDELLDLFLNCNADGVAIIDMENRFIRVNESVWGSQSAIRLFRSIKV